MASIWERAAEKSQLYVAEDFERAVYRLVTTQVLSASEPATRKDYHLVSGYLRDFKQVLDPLGIGLRHNAQFQYVVAQPRHVLNQNKASKAVTLLVLVLADIYHRVRFNGQEGDFGEAYVELPDLQEAYQGLTGHEFPKIGDLRELVADLERWGIARRHASEVDDPQPFRVMIHPAIANIVTKEWLGQLEGLQRQAGADEETEEPADVPA